MELFTDEVIRGLLAQSLETATVDANGWHDHGKGPGSRQGEYIDWLTIRDQAESVRSDVERIRNHPLVPESIPVHAYIYEVKTGRIVEVPGATAR
jgi:carbonic anhydrase